MPFLPPVTKLLHFQQHAQGALELAVEVGFIPIQLFQLVCLQAFAHGLSLDRVVIPGLLFQANADRVQRVVDEGTQAFGVGRVRSFVDMLFPPFAGPGRQRTQSFAIRVDSTLAQNRRSGTCQSI